MKKAGILTLQYATNVGALLQAYSLKTKLSNFYDVEIINYLPDHIINSKKRKFNFADLLRILAHPIFRYQIYKTKNNIAYFKQNYLCLGGGYLTRENISNINNIFDLIIVGSDQVWNLDITHNDKTYFLDFAPDKIKYTYAASSGKSLLPDNIIKNYISSFQSVLLREKTNIKQIEELTSKKCYSVSDPVFLISKEEFINNLHLKKRTKKRKYLLVYLILKDTYAIEFARKLAKEKNLDLYYIDTFQTRSAPKGFKNLALIDPISFLNYIYNAEIVVTTSFHGLSFSLIFNKDFYFELGKNSPGLNTRIENLENIFDISNRKIVSPILNLPIENINWDLINKKLCSYREHSLNTFLNSTNYDGTNK